MKTAYIVTKTRTSPIAIGYTVPHEAHATRKAAIARAKILNQRAARCWYEVVKVPFVAVEQVAA